MRLMTNGILVGGLTALLSVGLSGNSAAQTADTAQGATIEAATITVYQSEQPIKVPAAKAETKSAKAPSADAVWMPGHWDLRGNRNTASRAGWVWQPGAWVVPPVPGAKWDPGHWGWYSGPASCTTIDAGKDHPPAPCNRAYTWIPGHWVVPGKHGYPPSLEAGQETRLEMSAP